MGEFIFQLVLPVSYVSTEGSIGCNEELEPLLKSLSLHVRAEKLGIPPVPLMVKYHGIADDSPLGSMIQAYFNIPNLIYDIQGLQLLRDYFECPEGYAYSCLEFNCAFEIDYEFYQDYLVTLEDDEESIWDYSDYSAEWDSEGTFEHIKILFPAMEIFSEYLISTVSTLIAVMNLARPGCIDSRCGFLDRRYKSSDTASTVPDIRTFKLMDFSSYTQNTTLVKHAWEHFQPLPLKEMWQWINTIPGVLDGILTNTNIGRAINRYLLLFHRHGVGEQLLTTIAALETLFTTGLYAKKAQLGANIPNLLNIPALFSSAEAKNVIDRLYGQRSRFAHGDIDMFNPLLDETFYDDTMADATREAVIFLVAGLRYTFQLGLIHLPVPLWEGSKSK